MEDISSLNAKLESKSMKKNNSYVLLRQPSDMSFQNRQSCEKKQRKYEYAFPGDFDNVKNN